jgi:hypothetical protein
MLLGRRPTRSESELPRRALSAVPDTAAQLRHRGHAAARVRQAFRALSYTYPQLLPVVCPASDLVRPDRATRILMLRLRLPGGLEWECRRRAALLTERVFSQGGKPLLRTLCVQAEFLRREASEKRRKRSWRYSFVQAEIACIARRERLRNR